MKGECPLSERKIGQNKSSKISCPDNTHLMNDYLSLHRHSPYDPYDFTIYDQEQFIVWDANYL